MNSMAELALASLAALVAGAVNALAGGGTLITFPTLIGLGLPAISANVTNTVALCPGYLGGTLAQKSDLSAQRRRLLWGIPVGLAGGVGGGILVLLTGEKLFRELVPFLIFFASALLAIQAPVSARLRRMTESKRPDLDPAGGSRRSPSTTPDSPRSVEDGASLGGGSGGGSPPPAGRARGGPGPDPGWPPTRPRPPKSGSPWPALAVFPAAVYGGYFGAGLSVILLASLALLIRDTLTRLNALKQVLALAANLGAAAVFVTTGRVVWPLALAMAAAALIGGAAGGLLAGRVKPGYLRAIVVSAGFALSIIYLLA